MLRRIGERKPLLHAAEDLDCLLVEAFGVQQGLQRNAPHATERARFRKMLDGYRDVEFDIQRSTVTGRVERSVAGNYAIPTAHGFTSNWPFLNTSVDWLKYPAHKLTKNDTFPAALDTVPGLLLSGYENVSAPVIEQANAPL